MKLPNKILKCPIIDTVIEIRFNSKINPNAIFGIIYNNLKKEYPKVETLPILQIPEQLREKDPVFKYKPFYKISDGKYSLQIGYDVIAFGSVMPYPGWTMIETKFYKNIKQILASDIIDEVTRLGVRYINFFPGNVFDNIKLEFKSTFESLALSKSKTFIRTEIIAESFFSTLQIKNNVQRTQNNEIIDGSVIDIDTFKLYTDSKFKDNFKEEISKAHNIEKDLFFNILSNDFFNSLEPIYE